MKSAFCLVFQYVILDITEVDVSNNAVSFVKNHVNVITYREFVKTGVRQAGMENIVYSVSCLLNNMYS